MAWRGRETVLMIGPFDKLDGFRGISAVISCYFKHGDFGKYQLTYVQTSHHGGIARKVYSLMRGLWSMVMMFVKNRVCVVHMHSADFNSFYRKALFWFVAKLFSKKTVMHIHGARFREFYESRSGLGRWLVSQILSKTDSVIVLSEFWKQFIQSIAKNDAVYAVPNPVHGAELTSVRSAARASKVVLYMTMLYPRKGIYVLLEAVPHILEREPESRFIICGGGEIEQCMAYCREKGIIDSVEFRGWVDAKQKQSAFEEADVFVLPSFHEGLPVCLLEAMFAALPVVSTPVGGIPDIFVDGENGFLVPVGDASALAEKTIFLLRDKVVRDKIALRNQTDAFAKFDVNVVVNQLCKIYDQLCPN